MLLKVCDNRTRGHIQQSAEVGPGDRVNTEAAAGKQTTQATKLPESLRQATTFQPHITASHGPSQEGKDWLKLLLSALFCSPRSFCPSQCWQDTFPLHLPVTPPAWQHILQLENSWQNYIFEKCCTRRYNCACLTNCNWYFLLFKHFALQSNVLADFLSIALSYVLSHDT